MENLVLIIEDKIKCLFIFKKMYIHIYIISLIFKLYSHIYIFPILCISIIDK